MPKYSNISVGRECQVTKDYQWLVDCVFTEGKKQFSGKFDLNTYHLRVGNRQRTVPRYFVRDVLTHVLAGSNIMLESISFYEEDERGERRYVEDDYFAMKYFNEESVYFTHIKLKENLAKLVKKIGVAIVPKPKPLKPVQPSLFDVQAV